VVVVDVSVGDVAVCDVVVMDAVSDVELAVEVVDVAVVDQLNVPHVWPHSSGQLACAYLPTTLEALSAQSVRVIRVPHSADST
jgi:hypothetical protein